MANSPKAPTNAPAQVGVTTGKGTVAKTQATFQAPPGKAPQPPSAASTQYVKAGPSVDYNRNQGNRIPADVGRPHDGANAYENTPMLDDITSQQQQKV